MIPRRVARSRSSRKSGVTTLTYDSGDRLTGVTYPNGLSIQYTRDASGRRTRMVEKSGSTVSNTVNYAYNALGQLAKLTDGTGALVISYTYNNLGQLTRENKGDGTSTTYVYDANGNVLHLVNVAANGTTVDSRFDYAYDTLGERTSMATLDGKWTYSYDTTGQLIHAVFTSTNPAIANQDLAYVYDAVGNRTQTIINGVTTNYTSNSVNEYTSVGDDVYKYDANGNMISKTDASGTTTYAWDALNRLVGVISPTDTWTYTYDALGNRAATIHNGQETDNLIDPTGLGNVVGQYTASGSRIANYNHGLGLVSQITSGSTNYYAFDALGSTAGLTNATSGVVARYGYLPFGGLLASMGSVANPFTFVGQYGVSTDGRGLYDMRARDYDPITDHFVTPDPTGLLGGDTNLSRYVQNSPLAGIDPAGLGYWAIGPLALQVPGTDIQIPYAFRPDQGWYHSQYVRDDGTNTGYGPPGKLFSLPPDYVKKFYIPVEENLDDKTMNKNINDLVDNPGWKNKYWDRFSHPSGPKCRACQEFMQKTLPPNPKQNGNDGGGGGGDGSSGTAHPIDPNDLLGPAGYGSSNFVTANTPFSYQIDFENDAKATAPAQQVVIQNTLDPNLDLSTFQFTAIAFGDTVLMIPAGSTFYQAAVPMTYNGETFNVEIQASLDLNARQVRVKFQSINSDTQLPPDVLAGFLPPENGTGRGKGYVSYTVRPKGGLPTGTRIRNVAVITFDINGPIATDQVDAHDPGKGIDLKKQALVTLDAAAPASTVAALPPVETTASFTVSWSGQDDPGGSGVGTYNIYVTDNGGPLTAFLTNSTQTSATFNGTNGHTYAFYSVATDNAGNIQATPSAAQATTTVKSSTTAVATAASLQSSKNPSKLGDPLTFTATVTAASGTVKPTGTVQFDVDGQPIGSPVALISGSATSTAVSSMTVGSHTVSAGYVNTDGSFTNSTGRLSGGQTVNQATGTVALVPSVNNPVYGQSWTFTATVSTSGLGMPTPAGSMQFVVDGTNFGSTVALINGSATGGSLASLLAGSHTVSATYMGDGNYTGGTASAAQTVAKAHLNVTADANSSVYGAAIPALTATITGFVNGDTLGVVSGTASLETTAKIGSSVGSYPITTAIGTLSASNYDFPSLNGGTLAMMTAHLSVTADNKSRLKGAANPPLTYTITGFVNGDTTTEVSGSPSLSTAATTSSLAGTYPITVGQGTLTATNYDFPNLTNGILTVGAEANLDFEGIGHAQLAVFRPSTAEWFTLGANGGHLLGTFGDTQLRDIPVPGDYDGTGHTELAIFRPATAGWFISGHATPITFGDTQLRDIPVPGDYDGTGHTQLAIFRPATAQWFISGHATPITFGDTQLRDIPVPGDYDGTGQTKVAIFRPATAEWFISGHASPITFGDTQLRDIPVPGDYDGTGHTELAVFRPATAQWFVLGPNGGRLIEAFGATKLFDVPAGGPGASLDNLGNLPGIHMSSLGTFDEQEAFVITNASNVTSSVSPPDAAPNSAPVKLGLSNAVRTRTPPNQTSASAWEKRPWHRMRSFRLALPVFRAVGPGKTDHLQPMTDFAG